MPVQQTDGRILLQHPTGSSVEMLLYGAHILSWKSGTEKNTSLVERLFVSTKAILDGTKPVRGGIPVVFPCFGPPDPALSEHKDLPQHGFARNSIWKYDSVVLDNSDGVSVRLTLEPTPEIIKIYKRPFLLAFVVTLAQYQLTTALHVTNTSTSTEFPPDNLQFQALFHTYIKSDSSSVLVGPLQNVQYYDKTESTAELRATPKTESRAGVNVKQFTDFVYENAPGKYEVTWRGGGLDIQTLNLKDVVIWNPQEEAGSKISDMNTGGWNDFVCVEPGHVRGFAAIEPGKTWIGQQVLTVVHEERRLSL